MPHKRRFAALLAFALFALPSLAAITGSVMTTDGKPLAGARVSLYGPESTDARRVRLLSETPEAVPLASTQTDAKGAFSLESPKIPVATLRVLLRGYEPVGKSVERDEEALAIVLTKAEMRTGNVTAGGKPVAAATVVLSFFGADYLAKTNEEGRYEAPDPKRASSILFLHPDYVIEEELLYSVGANAIRGKLSRTLTKGTPLTGKIVGSDGKTPVANALISLNGWPLATSGEDGAFTIARAQAKWRSLVARKDSLVAFRLYAKDAAMTLKLAKGATFTGRVRDAKTKLPVAGANVRLGTRNFDPRTDLWLDTDVDAKGMYSLVAPAGSYALTVAHPAYDNDSAEGAAASGQQSLRDFSLQPLARITGVVVDEANKPVPAAAIAPEPTGDPFSMRGMRMTMREASSTTGPDGKFTLRVNGENELKIRASKKGLPTGRSDAMKLGPGERKSGVVIALPSGIEVTGKITDGDGNPLSGALVTSAETQGRGGSNVQRMFLSFGGQRRDDDAVQTASDGTFSMRLKEGAYDFTVRREGYSSKTVRAHTVSPAGTQPVEVKLDPAVEISGRITRGGVGIEGVGIYVSGGGGVDTNATTGPDGSFTLGNLTPGQVGVFIMKMGDFISEQRMLTAPGQDVVIELPPGGRVSGRVVEKGTRRPVTSFEAGITQSRGGGGPMMRMGPPQVRAFTSDDGSFVLENVPAGSATLVANAPGFVSGRLNVTVEEGKSLDDLVLELDTGVKLTGKVTGPNGSGLADVTVRLAPSATGGFSMSGGDKRAVTDENGEYTLDALNAGDETINFSHAKYLGTVKQVTLKGREMRLDVQLEAGARLSGIVVTEAGVPVGEADVRAFAPGSAPQSVQSNANGVFEFESLEPARYRFTASRAGYAEGLVENFDSATGGQLRIVLKTGGTIYGRVTGVSEQELANTYVVARGGTNYTQTPVDGTGSYRLEGAPVGSVQVAASVRTLNTSRSTPQQTVTVSAGGSVQVDLAFRSDVVVHGRVTRNGSPFGAGTVMFIPRAGGAGQSSASIDEQGNYSISGLEDGPYVVTVLDMQRLSPYSTSYEVRGSATFDIDYTTASIRGRVVDSSNNRPLSGANVVLRATSAVEVFRGRGAVSDENGVYVIDSVPAGSYTVTGSLDAYGSESKEVVVGESTLDNVELRLAQSDGITLNVVDGLNGRTIGASAILFDALGRVKQESQTPFIFSGEGSKAALKLPVAPGSYVATVYTQNYAPVHLAVTSPSMRTVALTPGGRIEIDSKHAESRRVQLIDSLGIAYPRFGTLPRKYELIPRTTTPLERIAPGRYTLQLLALDNTTVIEQIPVVVTEGQTTKAEI